MVKVRLPVERRCSGQDVGRRAELEGALQELASNAKAAGRPILVGLEAENGNSLSIALRGVETVLIFGRPNADPPYLTRRGVEETLDPVFDCYSLGVHHAEIPRSFVIPLEQGLRGLRNLPPLVNCRVRVRGWRHERLTLR